MSLRFPTQTRRSYVCPTGQGPMGMPVSYSRSTAFHFYWENETSNQHASSVPVSSQMIQQTTHALHTMAQPLPPTKSMASTIKSNEERGAAEESGGARFFCRCTTGSVLTRILLGVEFLAGVCWVCWQEQPIIVWMQGTNDTQKKRYGMGRSSCGAAVLRCYPMGTRRFTGAETLDQ